MTTDAKPKTPQELRQEREAAALRANLRKRKDQARARAASSDAPQPAASDRPTDRDAGGDR